MVAVETKSYSPPGESFSLRESSGSVHETQIQQALNKLRINYKGYELYKAGLPDYPRPFFRDTAIAGRLLRDPEMIAHNLLFASALQAKEADPIRGANKGKIFHEYDIFLEDGIELAERPGKNTLFNSCDSDGEYLIGHEDYFELTGDINLVHHQLANIREAANSIVYHINDKDFFEEDPRHCGADSFALNVTSWKDSALPQRENGVPIYPVVYPLVHAQTIAGLRSGGRILDDQSLIRRAQKMVGVLPDLYDFYLNSFFLGIDKLGPVRARTSDSLHMLAYLEPGDIPPDILEKIIQASEILETDIGYRTLDPNSADDVGDDYHTKTVWPQENAQTNRGAYKHLDWAVRNRYKNLEDGLRHVISVSRRPSKYYKENPGSYPETFLVNGDIKPSGCDTQLWSMAAASYFLRQAG